MKKISLLQKNRLLREKRTRKKIFRGDGKHLRLSVFKSNKHIYLQIIDDIKGNTLASAYEGELKNKKKGIELAKELGNLIAKKALGKKIEKIVFDRGRYAYHGIVKAVAEGAREEGLKF